MTNNYIQQFIEIDKKKMETCINNEVRNDTELTLCIMFGVAAICLLIGVNSFMNISEGFNNIFKEIVNFISDISHYFRLDEMARQISQLF